MTDNYRVLVVLRRPDGHTESRCVIDSDDAGDAHKLWAALVEISEYIQQHRNEKRDGDGRG